MKANYTVTLKESNLTLLQQLGFEARKNVYSVIEAPQDGHETAFVLLLLQQLVHYVL
jgi:hypothetical protein